MKTWVIYLIAGIAIAGIGFLLGYVAFHGKNTIYVDPTYKRELDKAKDSLSKLSVIYNLNKQRDLRLIDSLNKVINYNKIQYEKDIKGMADISVVSDDSITSIISNYIHYR